MTSSSIVPNRASAVVGRPPAEVFEFVTDIGRLAEWNDLITGVVEAPDEMRPGAVWKVSLADGPARWVSRSTVIEYDPIGLRFVHRSQTDDDNPSYSTWTWQIEADPAGARVVVTWSLAPRTRLRRWILAPFRSWRLRAEVPTSLERLRRALEHEAEESMP